MKGDVKYLELQHALPKNNEQHLLLYYTGFNHVFRYEGNQFPDNSHTYLQCPVYFKNFCQEMNILWLP